MSRRWLSIWLPEWPIERMAACARRRGEPFPHGRPLALISAEANGPRLLALAPAARAAGLRTGMTLTDARAALPTLEVREAEPWTDRTALASFALWCGRWSPRTAADGEDGILLDITGCAHLFGGEAGLLAEIAARFTHLGFTTRQAIADRRLAAWAWARLGAGGVLAAGEAAQVLRALPLEALRLAPATAAELGRLGLRQVGEVAALPRSALLTRFGTELATRLDELLEDGEPPFVPLQAKLRFAVRRSFAEPIGRTEDILATVRQLAWQLGVELERAREGARRVVLGLARVDGEVARLELRLGRPTRDAAHLVKLLAMRLDGVDAGFGIELVSLEAAETAPLEAEQVGLADPADARALARLTDQLALRLGPERVNRIEPVASHLPERAQRLVAATEPAAHEHAWPERPAPRPLRLLPRPAPVEVVAALPDGPPRQLRAGCQVHRVAAAAGPERILPEWWRVDGGGPPRDYYDVTVADGRRFWVHREGAYGGPGAPRWRLSGVFG